MKAEQRPAKATMILSSGLSFGRSFAANSPCEPSMAESMSCGNFTKPPAGMLPML